MLSKILPKNKIFIFSAIYYFILLSCSANEPCKECAKCGENLEYGTANSLTIDNIESVKFDTMVVVDQAFVENKMKIEEKFGEQWDFCRCVLANDSLDQLIKKNAELDDKFMKAFEEVDLKCKAFLVMSPNQTPDERLEHESKIKKCLKAARK